MLSSWSMSTTARCGCHSDRIVFASARLLRGPHDEEAVVERQLDEVHDQRAIVEHQGAERSG